MISEKEIDTAVARLFEARFRLGLFDPPEKVPFAQIPMSENDTPEHEALALRVARESIVLLKNDGVLPLNRAKIKRIAVIGANADSVSDAARQLQRHAGAARHHFDGIKKRRGHEHRRCTFTSPGLVPLAAAGAQDGSDKPNAEMLADAVAAAKSADVVIYVGGISPQLEGEEMQRELRRLQRRRPDAHRIAGRAGRNCSRRCAPPASRSCSSIAAAAPSRCRGRRSICPRLCRRGIRASRADAPWPRFCSATRIPPGGCRSRSTVRRRTCRAFEDYSMSNRTYRYFDGKPLFAFGHGLSYTKFEYSRRHAGQIQIHRQPTP